MKKYINSKESIVSEMLEGYILAHPGKDILKGEDMNILTRAKNIKQNKVGVIIGNGSGHEPGMIDLVGKGLFDVNVVGNIFAAPTPYQLLEGIKEADHGKGVLVLVSSHAGDILNAKMALMLAKMENIEARMAILWDDIASAPKGEESERRGTAGLFFSFKLVCAAAERGWDMESLIKLAERVRDNTRTIACALEAGTNPETGLKMFEIADDEIDIGLGVHGEQGRTRTIYKDAKTTAETMAEKLIEDLPFRAGDRIIVLLNNSGASTYQELMIVYKDLYKYLESKGIEVVRNWIGSYVTVQETHGFSMAFLRADDELISLFDDEADSDLFRRYR